jgi:hypothetical protein
MCAAAVGHTAPQGEGVALEAHGAALTARDAVVHGFSAGAKFNQTAAALRGVSFAGFGPEFQREFGGVGGVGGGGGVGGVGSDGDESDGDHDALYAAGGAVTLDACSFLDAADDGVDSGTGSGGHLSVEGCFVERCRHEGLALSNNGEGAKAVLVRAPPLPLAPHLPLFLSRFLLPPFPPLRLPAPWRKPTR